MRGEGSGRSDMADMVAGANDAVEAARLIVTGEYLVSGPSGAIGARPALVGQGRQMVLEEHEPVVAPVHPLADEEGRHAKRPALQSLPRRGLQRRGGRRLRQGCDERLLAKADVAGEGAEPVVV